MNFEFKQHTIILLIGPSGCGKSTFAQILKEQLNSLDYTCSIVSSDNIRRELLCDPNKHKYDDSMMLVSEQAFHLLFERVRSFTTWPVNHDFVIVDTTGISVEFRNQIKQISKDNQYNLDALVFLYNDKGYYYNQVDYDYHWIVRKHVDNLFRGMKDIKSSDYNQKITIKEPILPQYPFISEDDVVVKVNSDHPGYMDYNYDTVIVGDIHGCYDEFVELCSKFGINKVGDDKNEFLDLSNHYLILVGDYLDKGPKVKQLVNLLYNTSLVQNPKLSIVRGNHENFVIKYWDNQFSSDEETLKHFPTVYETDEEFRKRVCILYAYSDPFVVGPNYIVTHAPCPRKYLGKLDNYSLKAQRNFRYTHLSGDEVRQELQFLNEEDGRGLPYRFFGHIASKRSERGNTWFNLDTGCVNGNMLTGVRLSKNSKPYFESVKAKEVYYPSELFIFNKPKLLTFNDVERHSQKIGRSYIRNKVNFISGTVSPADKTE